MTAPATSIDAISGDIVISWTQPDPQGTSITGYLIEVASKDGLYWIEYKATCDGTDPSDLDCTIPMSVLVAPTPYTY